MEPDKIVYLAITDGDIALGVYPTKAEAKEALVEHCCALEFCTIYEVIAHHTAHIPPGEAVWKRTSY